MLRHIIGLTFIGMASSAWAQERAAAAVTAPNLVNSGNIAQMLAGLLLVLALIFGLAWLARRTGGLGAASSNSIRVLGGVALSHRERVVLLQVGETQLVVGVAPGRVQTLHVLDKPVALPVSGSFADKLKSAMTSSDEPPKETA